MIVICSEEAEVYDTIYCSFTEENIKLYCDEKSNCVF